MITLEAFANQEAKRIWASDAHRKRSLAKLHKFGAFRGYAQRPIDSFKPADVYAFMDNLSDTGSSKATVNRYLAAISSVFKHAVEMEIILKAPQIKWHDEGPGRPRYMSRDELQKLKFFLDNRQKSWIKHFVIVGLHTGMRLGEILSITVDSIKSDAEGDWIHLETTKNGDERWVPMNSQCKSSLQALDFNPARVFNEKQFYKTWDIARSHIAPNDKGFTFHTIRHTFASTAANELSVNTLVLGQLLGHKQPTTTAKYVHMKPAVSQRIAMNMGSEMSSNEPKKGLINTLFKSRG